MSEWRPSASLDQLRMRAATLARIRTFMAERATTEVSTPVITSAGVTEPQIESLSLAQPGGYLRTSPEYYHKRLLSAGLGDLYEIGPVFRAAEHGRLHRQEFTLLEWYRVDQDWQQLASETQALISACSDAYRIAWQSRQVSWQALFQECLGFDPLTDPAAPRQLTRNELPADCDNDMRLDYLFSERIQCEFPEGQLTVVHGYPAWQAALARLDPADPRLACRFEVFAGPLELANGYQELTDAHEQRARFERDNARRARLGRPTMPLDEALLAALAHGMPSCSGVALGLERLLMAISGARGIQQVMAFA
ncbi:MAG: EF-P lysine aminoacylase EpmA [Wenzhouxiangella sp.]|jgi:lysyl-tRNA synthetase class 2|nr:EF-P lysine aminoacylase EpmA [Wenzhouxiangella sp.]